MATIAKMFRDRIQATPDRRAYSAWLGGAWKDFTWREYEEGARAFGLGLGGLGMKRGDVVAILGGTRLEWSLTDVGALCVGGVTVGLYPTLQPDGIGSMRYILEHSEARFLVVESIPTFKAKIAPIAAHLKKVEHIIVWDLPARAERAGDAAATADAALDPRIVAWDDVCAKGRALAAKDPTAWTAAIDAARPEDLALLIYTSGTTGQPKGAMLSHGNIWALQEGLAVVQTQSDPEPNGGTTVSFLPMAHAAERCVGHYGRIKQGRATHFARSIETLLEDLAVAKPTGFGSVPRIFEKVYAKVTGELAKATGWKAKLARYVFEGGVEAGRWRKRGDFVPLPYLPAAYLFEKRIAAPLRARFGGQCTRFISGAAPIAVEILEFFDACGMPTYEAYGLTETSGILTFNSPAAQRYGTVGKPIPCVELEIADDGEILARGGNIFQGYFKDPAATAEALAGGWFHTGDIGKLDRGGFLRITDRKKNILVTAGGKNITPSNIENEVKNHPLISYCHLHADKRAFPTALICLDAEFLKAFAKEHNLPGTTATELRDDPVVRAAVQVSIDKANNAFAQFERIKKFTILPSEFSVDGGELTPTLKVKRKTVDQKYASELEQMYA